MGETNGRRGLMGVFESLAAAVGTLPQILPIFASSITFFHLAISALM